MWLDDMTIGNIVQIVLIHCMVRMQARNVHLLGHHLAHHPQGKLGLVMNDIQLQLTGQSQSPYPATHGNAPIGKRYKRNAGKAIDAIFRLIMLGGWIGRSEDVNVMPLFSQFITQSLDRRRNATDLWKISICKQPNIHNAIPLQKTCAM